MNKFFKQTDKKINKLGEFDIPATWWSRPYEYAFALDFLKEKETILDVGCGLEHPFKIYASSIVEKVVALDIDKNIKKLRDKKIKYVCDDILTYKNDKQFDKIFCISTLEHTQTFLVEKLENMKNLLKDKGRIIITVDYPTLKPEKLENYVKQAGLKIDGKSSYKDMSDAIYSEKYRLYCYSMILKK